MTKKTRRLSSSSGFSLIEVIIAAAIVGIVALGFAQLTQNQTLQNRGLREQLTSAEAQNQLTSTLSRATICTSSLAGQSFNSLGASPQISLTHLNASAAGSTLFAVNTPASALTPEMQVQSITLQNITSLGTDSWTGVMQVAFSSTGLVRALRPIQTHINFVTNPASPVTAKVVTSCGATVDYPTAREFTLTLNRNQGTRASCGSPNNDSVSTNSTGDYCGHYHSGSIVENHSSIPMNGFSLCFLSGSKTMADDANMYDSCNVRQVAPGQWKLEIIMHPQNALSCRALCIP